MLKRLLKTSAIKNVLGGGGGGNGVGGGPLHGGGHHRAHLFDFGADMGQPPPVIPYKKEHLA